MTLFYLRMTKASRWRRNESYVFGAKEEVKQHYISKTSVKEWVCQLNKT